MSVKALTDIQIFNEALKRLGLSSGFVTAIDGTDTSKYGTLAYPTYYLTRDAELRSNDWARVRKRVTLSQAYVDDTGCSWTSGSKNVTVTDSSNIKVGWVIGTNLIQGTNPPPQPPTGIVSGATVASITDGTTIVMSDNATASGSGEIIFQQNNGTGYLFVYEAPSDELRITDIYAVYPASAYLFPYQIEHTVSYPFRYERDDTGEYIYTDLYVESGSVMAEYIYEPADGTTPFAMDFIDALVYRIASQLCMAITRDAQLKMAIDQEYLALMIRAFGTSNREQQQDNIGEPWCR